MLYLGSHVKVRVGALLLSFLHPTPFNLDVMAGAPAATLPHGDKVFILGMKQKKAWVPDNFMELLC